MTGDIFFKNLENLKIIFKTGNGFFILVGFVLQKENMFMKFWCTKNEVGGSDIGIQKEAEPTFGVMECIYFSNRGRTKTVFLKLKAWFH